MAEILASLDDINAELPSLDDTPVVVATDENSGLIQIAVARTVRGYLSRVVDNGVLALWTTPPNTPELIRVAAGKIIAAQLYFNKSAEQTTEITADSFAQKRYNEGMKILEDIVSGQITIPDVETTPTDNLTSLDFWPVDATGRAFTMSQEF